MESEQFWLVLLSGIVIGMLFSMGLRWIGGKVLGKPRVDRKASLESDPTQTNDQPAPELKGRGRSGSK